MLPTPRFPDNTAGSFNAGGEFTTGTPFKGTLNAKNQMTVTVEGSKCELTYALKPLGKAVALKDGEAAAEAPAADAKAPAAAGAKAADKPAEAPKKSSAAASSASVLLAVLCAVLAFLL